MQISKLFSRQQLLMFLAIIFIGLPLSVYIYNHRSNAYSVPKNTTITFTDPTVLQNWLPQEAYKYTVARLNDYIHANNPQSQISYLIIRGGVQSSSDGLAFNVTFMPEDVTHQVIVKMVNYDSVISTAVVIDNALQTVSIPQTNQGILFNGMSYLVDVGLSASQAQDVQQAFQTFKPSASGVTIVNGSVGSGVDPSGTTGGSLFSFVVNVDKTTYKAKIITSGLTGARLYLFDTASGKQVFDSGMLNGTN